MLSIMPEKRRQEDQKKTVVG